MVLGWQESESESEVAQSYPTLCDPVDCSPPGSSVHGILQARILEWVAGGQVSTADEVKLRTPICSTSEVLVVWCAVGGCCGEDLSPFCD